MTTARTSATKKHWQLVDGWIYCDCLRCFRDFVRFGCRVAYTGEKAVFEEMKELISQLGKLADERPANLGAGYLVDRPELLKHCLRCWAPCGCCVTYMNANAYVYTACKPAAEQGEEHPEFAWEDAKRAIEAFLAAEERSLKVLSAVEVVEKAQEVEEVEAVQSETVEPKSEEKSSESSESFTERSTEHSSTGSAESRPGTELETE